MSNVKIEDSSQATKDAIKNISLGTFGEIYSEDGQAVTPITQIPNVTPVLYTGFDTDGESDNVTNDQTNNRLKALTAGTYEVSFSCSFSGTGGSLSIFEIYRDLAGTPTPTERRVSRRLGASGDVDSCGIVQAKVVLAANEELGIYVNCDGATDIINTHDVLLTMKRV